MRKTWVAAAAVAAMTAASLPALAEPPSGSPQGPPGGPPVPPPDERKVAPHERPAPRAYPKGAGKVVLPTSAVGRKYNPHGDPNIRVCEMVDGSYIIMNTLPIPGQNPYPDDPDDLRYRPC